MAILIGDGSHATDMRATLPAHTVQVAHHRDLHEWSGQVWIGINDPRLRARVAAELDTVDLPWVHPDAWLGVETTIGSGTHVNYGVRMTRTRIGRWCTISPAVTICGDVTIGDRVLIGAGATICDRVTIGDDVTVGAGAVVLPCTRLETGGTYVGVPAR